jgi:choline transporter-like protein 2/4/5
LRRACFNQHHLKMRNSEIVRKCERAADGAMFAGWVCTALASFAICAALTNVDFLTIRGARWTLAPASCAALAGTVVFFAFFMAHREAVETIIQCFCEDTERNNGTPLRQYYAPAALKKLIFVDVQGHRAPSDRDADDAFEAEFKRQRRAKKEARRERKSNSSRMGSVKEEA